MPSETMSCRADALRSSVGGRVHAAGEDGYNAARLPWQRKLDPPRRW